MFYLLALPVVVFGAIGATVTGRKHRDLPPSTWLLIGVVTTCLWLGVWYVASGDGSPEWLVWAPVGIFGCGVFAGLLQAQTGEPTTGLSGAALALTGLAIYGGVQVIEPTPEALVGHKAPVNSLALSPDGTRLLSGSEDGQLILWEVATGERTSLGPHPKGVGDVHWAKGVAISVDYRGGVKAWDSSGAESGSWNAGAGFSCAALSPDGQKLAVGTLTGNVDTLDATTGENSDSVVSGEAGISALAFSPSSRNLAVGQLNGGLAIYGSNEARFEPASSVTCLLFLNDDELAAGYGSGEIRVFNVRSGTETYVLSGISAPVRDLAAQGKTLVSLHNDRGVARWDLGGRKLAGRAQLGTGSGPPCEIELLPSGDALAGNGRQIARISRSQFK